MKIKFFYQGTVSNWHRSPFILDNLEFINGEQWMMYQKAMLFGDNITAVRIMETISPREQKSLGRRVIGYNDEIWDKERFDLVKRGLREKFLQNKEMYAELKNFKGYFFVEASPTDRIWGIGFEEKDALANIENWGENLLGKILTELAEEL